MVSFTYTLTNTKQKVVIDLEKRKKTNNDYEDIKNMMRCYEHFMDYNTRENKKSSCRIWHLILTADPKLELDERQLLQEFAYFNKRLSRELGCIPPYTRRIERGEHGILHLHVLYWSLREMKIDKLDRLWRVGHIEFPKHQNTNELKFVDNLDYMKKMANYIYGWKKDEWGDFSYIPPKVNVKRVTESSRGLLSFKLDTQKNRKA